jgi:hypothetical protein
MRHEVASLIQKSFAAFLAACDDEKSETDYLQAWLGMRKPWTRECSLGLLDFKYLDLQKDKGGKIMVINYFILDDPYW